MQIQETLKSQEKSSEVWMHEIKVNKSFKKSSCGKLKLMKNVWTPSRQRKVNSFPGTKIAVEGQQWKLRRVKMLVFQIKFVEKRAV